MAVLVDILAGFRQLFAFKILILSAHCSDSVGLAQCQKVSLIFKGKSWLQCFNKIGCLTFFMTAFCCIYGFAINGALLTAISTMEKRFELSSTISGVMLASYDIGFLITTIPLEALTRDMNRGRVLGKVHRTVRTAKSEY